jgi:hypothetical protein
LSSLEYLFDFEYDLRSFKRQLGKKSENFNIFIFVSFFSLVCFIQRTKLLSFSYLPLISLNLNNYKIDYTQKQYSVFILGFCGMVPGTKDPCLEGINLAGRFCFSLIFKDGHDPLDLVFHWNNCLMLEWAWLRKKRSMQPNWCLNTCLTHLKKWLTILWQNRLTFIFVLSLIKEA